MPDESPKLVSPKFRGSYVNVMKARAIGDGDPEYGMTIVLDKEDDEHLAFLAKLKKAMKAAAAEKIGADVPPEKWKHYPITDGDDSDQEEFHGKWLIRTKNKRQPGILVLEEDGTRRAVERESEIYSGAWYHASLRPYAWKNEFGKGVSISLNGVLKVQDDEQFGGSFNEGDFDEVSKPTGKKKASSDF
jgi:hypothetical protein